MAAAAARRCERGEVRYSRRKASRPASPSGGGGSLTEEAADDDSDGDLRGLID